MKTCRHTVIILFLALLIGSEAVDIARAAQLETSVVRLDLNGRKYSESFELIDIGETVLLPLRSLARLLDAEVTLDPNAMTAKVVRSWDKQEAVVDLDRQLLLFADDGTAMVPPAMAGAGDYFLPIAIVQTLFDVRVEWNARSQVLSLSTSRELSVQKAAKGTNNTKPSPQVQTMQKKPQSAAPPISLGSVQYVITSERSSDDIRWPYRDEMNFDVHLQSAGIPIDLAGKLTDFLTDKRAWSLERATATYRSPTVEVAVGDTVFGFSRILQNSNIRGLRYSSPPNWTSGQLHAFTVIEGWVEPRSEVELTINGFFLGKTKAGDDGYYTFMSVPLQILKPNTVVLTIIEEDGNRTTETRTITATPRLLPKGEIQSAAGGGLVRAESGEGWSSIIKAGSVYTGITSWLTIGGELAHQTKLDSQGNTVSPAILAGNVGATLRTGDNLLFSLDWMLSEPEKANRRPDQGVDFTANLQLRQLAVQSVMFYRESGLTLFTRTETDVKGYRAMFEYEFSKAFNVGGSVQRAYSVSDEEREPDTKLGAVLRWVPTKNDTSVLKLERQVRVNDKVQLDYQHSSPSTNVKFEAAGNWVENERAERRINDAQTRLEISHVLSPNLAASLGRSDQLTWPYVEPPKIGQPQTHQSTSEVQLSWFPEKSQLTAAARLQNFRWRDEAEKSVSSSYGNVSLNLAHVFGPAIGGVIAGFQRDLGPEESGSALLGSAYIGAKNRGGGLTGQLKLDYLRPLSGSIYTESLKVSLRGGYLFGNGLFAGLTGQMERKNWEKTDYYVGLTISQGIGFSNGGVRGFRAVSGNPLGYVDGTVYIDVNRNGKRDQGEKCVADAPVALAGRRTKTDMNGYYCFEFVNAGVYDLGLDPSKLPADYTALTETKLIKLPENANFTQDLAVALNGTVEGTVFLDFDHNGKPDKGEFRPAWVKLLLDGKVESFTDERGSFTFSNIDLGQHVVTVDPKSLPPGVVAPDPITVEINEENLDAWDVLVPLGQTTP